MAHELDITNGVVSFANHAPTPGTGSASPSATP